MTLNAEPFDSLDVDERRPPFVKLTDAQHHAQLLATFLMDNPLEFTRTNVMKLQAISKKWQHQWTIESFFKSIQIS